MPITARAASDKISELRSKLAVYHTWRETIEANYLPSDGGTPEVRITREDGGNVTEAHLESVIEEITEKCTELQQELDEWEALVFEPKQAEVHPINEPPKQQQPERSKLSARRVRQAAK